jgi:hypothetical protein
LSLFRLRQEDSEFKAILSYIENLVSKNKKDILVPGAVQNEINRLSALFSWGSQSSQ